MLESVSAVISAYNGLYDVNVPIEMVAHADLGRISKDGAWGAAQFKRGEPVAVWISDELPYAGVADVLAHEFAHVAVGIEHGHDKIFKNAYRRIRSRAKKILGANQ